MSPDTGAYTKKSVLHRGKFLIFSNLQIFSKKNAKKIIIRKSSAPQKAVILQRFSMEYHRAPLAFLVQETRHKRNGKKRGTAKTGHRKHGGHNRNHQETDTKSGDHHHPEGAPERNTGKRQKGAKEDRQTHGYRTQRKGESLQTLRDKGKQKANRKKARPQNLFVKETRGARCVWKSERPAEGERDQRRKDTNTTQRKPKETRNGRRARSFPIGRKKSSQNEKATGARWYTQGTRQRGRKLFFAFFVCVFWCSGCSFHPPPTKAERHYFISFIQFLKQTHPLLCGGAKTL